MRLHTAYLAMGRCHADGVVVIIDVVAVRIYVAVVVDVCSVILIVAGGTQPPPARTAVYSRNRKFFMTLYLSPCTLSHNGRGMGL